MITTMTKPEIDGKRDFRAGMSIDINYQFENDYKVIERLRLDDANPATKCKYEEKDRPKYRFSKYYPSYRRPDEIIIERVFENEPTRTWFGIADRMYGTLHFYSKLKSKYPFIKKSNDDIGLFYRYGEGQIIAYSTDDSEAVTNTVKYIFEHPEETKEYMVRLKEMNDRFKESECFSAPLFYSGTASQNTGFAILEV